MREVGSDPAAEDYRAFAVECEDSPCYRSWAEGVAGDPEVLALLAGLPPRKRQPNLVFAAARWHGAGVAPYPELRELLLAEWDAVRATVLARATQTNEVGRCAALLPLLAGLPQPLALLEVGASAGLCLLPDRWSYRYATTGGEVAVDPDDGPSEVVLRCRVEGAAPLPQRLPQVAWRAGIDLNPLDVHDDDAVRWLRTLVWPEDDDRRDRLTAAVGVARTAPPRLVRGDLVEQLPGLAAQAPADATLVVFHSAVLAYLDAADRARFVATVRDLRGHWVSNEGPTVVTEVAAGAAPPPGSVASPGFALALDGRQVAWAHGHGRGLRWVADASAGPSVARA